MPLLHAVMASRARIRGLAMTASTLVPWFSIAGAIALWSHAMGERRAMATLYGSICWAGSHAPGVHCWQCAAALALIALGLAGLVPSAKISGRRYPSA